MNPLLSLNLKLLKNPIWMLVIALFLYIPSLIDKTYIKPTKDKFIDINNFTANLQIKKDGLITVEEDIEYILNGEWYGWFRSFEFDASHINNLSMFFWDYENSVWIEMVQDPGFKGISNNLNSFPRPQRRFLNSGDFAYYSINDVDSSKTKNILFINVLNKDTLTNQVGVIKNTLRNKYALGRRKRFFGSEISFLNEDKVKQIFSKKKIRYKIKYSFKEMYRWRKNYATLYNRSISNKMGKINNYELSIHYPENWVPVIPEKQSEQYTQELAEKNQLKVYGKNRINEKTDQDIIAFQVPPDAGNLYVSKNLDDATFPAGEMILLPIFTFLIYKYTIRMFIILYKQYKFDKKVNTL
jgi:hypothetical protein